MSSAPVAVILAAGKGTRMKSDLPKVLARALGRPLVEYVLDAAQRAGIERSIVVVGYRGELVRAALAGRTGVEYAEQAAQLGTGHAVMMCREALRGCDGPVLVLTGDSPLTQTASIRRLLDEFRAAPSACVMGTLHKENPAGLGRVVRDDQGEFAGIVEEKDADERQRAITEVNMSMYVFDAQRLLWALDQLRADNQQREYYITDCPGILRRAGLQVRALPVLQSCEAMSVNTVDELAAVERVMRQMGYPA